MIELKSAKWLFNFSSDSTIIPDAIGVAIETPYGYVVNPGDFKLDHVDEVPTEEEEKLYSFFNDKKVLMFLGESTNIENPGFSTPERLVLENLDGIVRDIKGRLIVGGCLPHTSTVFLRL